MSSPASILALLDQLAEVRAAADVTRIDYEAKKVEILASVQAELEALDAEYQPLLDSADERAAALEGQVKQEVLEHGVSVRGSRLYAVYNRGRVSWDSDRLDQYAIAHPEVVEFRKHGEPHIAIRVVK